MLSGSMLAKSNAMKPSRILFAEMTRQDRRPTKFVTGQAVWSPTSGTRHGVGAHSLARDTTGVWQTLQTVEATP